MFDAIMFQYDLKHDQKVEMKKDIGLTLAFTRAASACVFSPDFARRYPGFVGLMSGSTPTELIGQLTPMSADMSAATSACSTS